MLLSHEWVSSSTTFVMHEYDIMSSPTDLAIAVLYILMLLMLEQWWSMNLITRNFTTMTRNFTTHAVLEIILDVECFTHVVL